MEHQKFSIQISFRRKLNSLQICLSHAKSKNASFERYGSKGYRLFWKVNKDIFWVKTHNLNMVNSIEMKPKGGFRRHRELSKMVKNTFIGLKLRKIHMVKVGRN